MPLHRVAVVFKPLSASDTPAALARSSDPLQASIAARRELARAEHEATLAAVRAALRAAGVEAEITDRASIELVRDAALVIAVGGDGTFLHVARLVRETPMLGVNSSPSTSTGHYCAATASDFADHLSLALGGASAPRPLVRIAASIDGEPLPFTALNDALFANTSPVASTRYVLQHGGQDERQLSSGLWIATASGSTGALRSAGGDPMASDDRRLQFVVREPCPDASGGPRLVRGFVEGAIALASRSDRNALFLDGHDTPWPVPLGATARLAPAPAPLWVFGYPPAAR